MQSILTRALLAWVPMAVAISGVAGIVYAAVQQDLRQAANDPQVQMAEDAAARLAAGSPPQTVVPAASVDMATSLQPYLLIFDSSRHLVASSGTLDGQTPSFPTGALEAASAGRQDRVTWQPAPGVRSATVVQRWTGGFVVAGRSLRLEEERQNQLLVLTGSIWLATLGATGLATLLVVVLGRQLTLAGTGPSRTQSLQS